MEQQKIFACLGLISAVISVFFATLVFAPLAIILGYIAMKKGEYRLGRLALSIGVVLTVLNIVMIIARVQ